MAAVGFRAAGQVQATRKHLVVAELREEGSGDSGVETEAARPEFLFHHYLIIALHQSVRLFLNTKNQYIINMKIKIAVPVNESGALDSHFGHCRYFAFLEAEGGKIVSEELRQPPPHEPGLLPRWLAEQNVTDVIAGGMGNRALQLFNSHNIRVFTGAPVMQAKELAMGFLAETVQFNGNRCDH